MKYNIINLVEQDNKNSILISRQKTKNNKQESNIIVLNSSNHLFKKIRDFSIDWEVMPNRVNNWIVEFDRFDYRLLPFLNVNFLIKAGDGSIAVDDYLVQSGYCFVTTDILDETFMKKVSLHAFIVVASWAEISYYSKLNVKFINPRDYR